MYNRAARFFVWKNGPFQGMCFHKIGPIRAIFLSNIGLQQVINFFYNLIQCLLFRQWVCCICVVTQFVPPRVYFCQILVPKRLLISPMVPLWVYFSAKMVPLRIWFWKILVPFRGVVVPMKLILISFASD